MFDFFFSLSFTHYFRYYMVFTPIFGRNNHGRCINFGVGLLSQENSDYYSWLLSKFVECMWSAPKILITDQDRGINVPLKVCFKTRHQFCMWHIMTKLEDKVSATLRNNYRFRPDVISKREAKSFWTVLWRFDSKESFFKTIKVIKKTKGCCSRIKSKKEEAIERAKKPERLCRVCFNLDSSNCDKATSKDWWTIKFVLCGCLFRLFCIFIIFSWHILIYTIDSSYEWIF